MKTISIWGEGVAGKVHLEIQKIQATGCATSSLRGAKTEAVADENKAFNSTCSGDIQASLRFNLTAAGKGAVNDLPFPVAAGEVGCARVFICVTWLGGVGGLLLEKKKRTISF